MVLSLVQPSQVGLRLAHLKPQNYVMVALDI
jgi:hypothetical protein